LYVPFKSLFSKFNLYIIESNYSKADEICIIDSYSVSNDLYSTSKGKRKIDVGSFDENYADDGLFVAVLIKDGQTIKVLTVMKPEAEYLIGDNA
jgi:hypothetical protein